ncbi:MAG: recombinase family protein, partial [Solirubrobacteraceae bacterium]
FLAAEASPVALGCKPDAETPSGRLVASVIMAVADGERATIAARTTASLHANHARGEGIGRPAVVDRPELAARIATLRGEGLTLQAICDELNADGVPTPRGAPMWRRSSVQSAAGYTRPRPRRLPPELPPLPRRRKTSR